MKMNQNMKMKMINGNIIMHKKNLLLKNYKKIKGPSGRPDGNKKSCKVKGTCSYVYLKLWQIITMYV